MVDYPYNDDLLTKQSDQDRAKIDYGPIAFALIFPALVAKTMHADDIANKAKRRLRQIGLGSVGLVTFALLVTSSAPIYHEYHTASVVLVILAAICGTIGGLLGLGVISTGYKTVWLEHRLLTESYRQLHFRTLISLAPDIVAAAETGQHEAFELKRKAALDGVINDVAMRKDSILEAIAENKVRRPIPHIEPMPDPSLFSNPHAALILKAYRDLRIVRQMQYAEHKLLKNKGVFSSSPHAQARTLSLASIACVALLLVLHIASAALLTWDEHEIIAPSLEIFAIWTAVIALAIRAVEAGLKPREEVERYRHYQAATARNLERFEESDVPGKLAAVEALERAAYDEMIIFLRSHSEARFTM